MPCIGSELGEMGHLIRVIFFLIRLLTHSSLLLIIGSSIAHLLQLTLHSSR